MDLIDRNALESFYESGTDPNDTYADMTFIRSEHIENAPAVNRWISVEDALPEKAGNYLCTLYYAIPPYNLFHPEKDTYIREVSVKFFDGKSFIASVVAWMPLPDAYEPPEKE
jgi:hypothetical protein